ncbi:hypothetical protein [Mycoplasma sp. P36-A1]|uniref:hypothetical protein n=1 Tax=Mycoplasma sp. P36-A1 TaxID=3252900 RepID=UPI003C2C0103
MKLLIRKYFVLLLLTVIISGCSTKNKTTTDYINDKFNTNTSFIMVVNSANCSTCNNFIEIQKAAKLYYSHLDFETVNLYQINDANERNEFIDRFSLENINYLDNGKLFFIKNGAIVYTSDISKVDTIDTFKTLVDEYIYDNNYSPSNKDKKDSEKYSYENDLENNLDATDELISYKIQHKERFVVFLISDDCNNYCDLIVDNIVSFAAKSQEIPILIYKTTESSSYNKEYQKKWHEQYPNKTILFFENGKVIETSGDFTIISKSLKSFSDTIHDVYDKYLN